MAKKRGAKDWAAKIRGQRGQGQETARGGSVVERGGCEATGAEDRVSEPRNLYLSLELFGTSRPKR